MILALVVYAPGKKFDYLVFCKKAPRRKNLDVEFKQQYSTACLQKKHKKNVS